MKKRINLAIVGATGLVGREFLKIIEKRKFPYNQIHLFASDSKNRKTVVNNKTYSIEKFDKNCFKNIDFAFFSAGEAVDKIIIPQAVKMGAICIDNSSAFRLEKGIPLVVPEINFEIIKKNDRIIANPNCSTIQLALVLNILRNISKIKRIVLSTYQAVSGSGKEAVSLLLKQSKGINAGKNVYYNNIIQSIGTTLKNGFCEEENKIMNETKKILNDDSLEISATTMRVPLLNVHTESVMIEFKDRIDLQIIKKLLKNTCKSVRFMNSMESRNADGKDFVYVSRLRADPYNGKVIHLIITSDNLRIGAALNAVKIAENLMK